MATPIRSKYSSSKRQVESTVTSVTKKPRPSASSVIPTVLAVEATGENADTRASLCPTPSAQETHKSVHTLRVMIEVYTKECLLQKPLQDLERVKGLAEHQSTAQDHAGQWADVAALLIDVNEGIAAYSTKFDKYTSVLLGAVDKMSSGGEEEFQSGKRTFLRGLDLLLQGLEHNADLTQSALTELTKFNEAVISDHTLYRRDLDNVKAEYGNEDEALADAEQIIESQRKRKSTDLSIIAGGATAGVVGLLTISVSVVLLPETGGSSVYGIYAGIAIVGTGVGAVAFGATDLENARKALREALAEKEKLESDYKVAELVKANLVDMVEKSGNAMTALTSMVTQWQTMKSQLNEIKNTFERTVSKDSFDPDFVAFVVEDIGTGQKQWNKLGETCDYIRTQMVALPVTSTDEDGAAIPSTINAFSPIMAMAVPASISPHTSSMPIAHATAIIPSVSFAAMPPKPAGTGAFASSVAQLDSDMTVMAHLVQNSRGFLSGSAQNVSQSFSDCLSAQMETMRRVKGLALNYGDSKLSVLSDFSDEQIERLIHEFNDQLQQASEVCENARTKNRVVLDQAASLHSQILRQIQNVHRKIDADNETIRELNQQIAATVGRINKLRSSSNIFDRIEFLIDELTKKNARDMRRVRDMTFEIREEHRDLDRLYDNENQANRLVKAIADIMTSSSKVQDHINVMASTLKAVRETGRGDDFGAFARPTLSAMVRDFSDVATLLGLNRAGAAVAFLVLAKTSPDTFTYFGLDHVTSLGGADLPALLASMLSTRSSAYVIQKQPSVANLDLLPTVGDNESVVKVHASQYSNDTQLSLVELVTAMYSFGSSISNGANIAIGLTRQGATDNAKLVRMIEFSFSRFQRQAERLEEVAQKVLSDVKDALSKVTDDQARFESVRRDVEIKYEGEDGELSLKREKISYLQGKIAAMRDQIAEGATKQVVSFLGQEAIFIVNVGLVVAGIPMGEATGSLSLGAKMQVAAVKKTGETVAAEALAASAGFLDGSSADTSNLNGFLEEYRRSIADLAADELALGVFWMLQSKVVDFCSSLDALAKVILNMINRLKKISRTLSVVEQTMDITNRSTVEQQFQEISELFSTLQEQADAATLSFMHSKVD